MSFWIIKAFATSLRYHFENYKRFFQLESAKKELRSDCISQNSFYYFLSIFITRYVDLVSKRL